MVMRKENGMTFIPTCPHCRRFVTPDVAVFTNGIGEHVEMPNATCKMHGRVKMDFLGFFDIDDF